jgi:hypothetical protein
MRVLLYGENVLINTGKLEFRSISSYEVREVMG